MNSIIKTGTTWTRSYIEKISNMNKKIGEKNGIVVGEVYGSIPCDPIGSARSKDRLHQCNYDKLGEHVKLCHDHGIEVCYANNALCMGSSSSIDKKRDLFLSHTEKIIESGINSIIYANELWIELAKKYFPNIKLVVSTIADVNSVKRAQYYQNAGVDVIVLPVDVNRNFLFLQSLKQTFKKTIEFELLMTDACVYECSYRHHHFATQSHDSREDISSNFNKHEEVVDYPFDRCWAQITKNWPAEFLKSRWIRPEDMFAYEGLGFSKFKISGRTMPEKMILRSVKAYLSRCHDGNLLEILPIIPGNYKKEGHSPLEINNKRLNSFLDYFMKKKTDCRVDCQTTCTYCDDHVTKLM